MLCSMTHNAVLLFLLFRGGEFVGFVRELQWIHTKGLEFRAWLCEMFAISIT